MDQHKETYKYYSKFDDFRNYFYIILLFNINQNKTDSEPKLRFYKNDQN